jgi:hypothetical protein
MAKRLNNMTRQHTIPWNKLRAVPSILHTVGVNWNSRSEIDTANTGKCDVELNNKQVLIKCFDGFSYTISILAVSVSEPLRNNSKLFSFMALKEILDIENI